MLEPERKKRVTPPSRQETKNEQSGNRTHALSNQQVITLSWRLNRSAICPIVVATNFCYLHTALPLSLCFPSSPSYLANILLSVPPRCLLILSTSSSSVAASSPVSRKVIYYEPEYVE
jgi:hypothetical protein